MSFLASTVRILVLRVFLVGVIVLTDIVLSRYLGPEYKGYAVILTLTPVLLAVLAGMGQDYALNLFGHRGGVAIDAVLHSSVVLAGLASAGLAIFLGANTFGALTAIYAAIPVRLQFAMHLSLVIIPAEVLFVIAGMYVMTRGAPEWFAGMRVTRRACILAIFVTVILTVRGLDLHEAINAYLVAQILGISAAVVIGSVAGGYRAAGGMWELGTVLREGFRSYPGRIADRFQTRVGVILLGIMGGGTAVGLYSVSAGIAEAVFFVSNTASTILFGRRSVDNLQLHRRVIRLMFPVGIFLILLIGLVGWFAVPLGWGAPFKRSRLILLFLLPGVFLYAMVQVMTPLMVQSHQTRSVSVAQSLGLGANIGLNLILIPSLGPYGTACASSVGFGLVFTVLLFVFARQQGMSIFAALIPTLQDFQYAKGRIGRFFNVVG